MADDFALIIKVVIGMAVVVIGILVIVLPMSFASLEYYEYGFKRQKSTGKVDLSKVYTSGKHFVGPDYEFKPFRSDSHNVVLKRISAFTQDKLEVKVSCSFQYYLRKRDLALLHQAYDVYYKDVMESSSNDAVKGSITVFNTRELFGKRAEVEKRLFKAVRERLGGICCPEDCSWFTDGCDKDCKATGCKDSEKGIFADVRYFQLGEIEIPGDVENRFLTSLTLSEDSLREQLLQDAQVVRKETDQLTRKTRNEALEISQNAEATSSLVQAKSRANYTQIIEKARSSGLKKLYTNLGITSQEHKNSFDYLRTLRGLDNVHLTVDFDQKIAGKL